MISLPLIIVAGGKSSRMGSDKALLPFAHSKTLTQFQLDRFKNDFLSVHISCKNKDKFDFKAQFIEDDTSYPQSSPLVALMSILTHFQTPVALLSVDTPFVTQEIFASLQAHLSQDYDAAVARSSFGTHPLCASYRPCIQTQIATMLKEDNHKIGNLLNTISTCYVDFDSDEPFFNLNYKSDYEKAQKQLKLS